MEAVRPPVVERPSTLVLTLCDGVKTAMVNVIDRYFSAERRGAIPPFVSAGKRISFSRDVHITTAENWEARSAEIDRAVGTDRALTVKLFERYYPSVLVTSVMGTGIGSSITSMHAPELPTIDDPDLQNVYRLMAQRLPGSFMAMATPRDYDPSIAVDQLHDDEVAIGGYAQLTVSLTCVARSGGEADRLADVTWVLLSHPAFKYAFQKECGAELYGEAAFGGSSKYVDPATGNGIYGVDISVPVRGAWEDRPMRLRSTLAVLLGIELVDP